MASGENDPSFEEIVNSPLKYEYCDHTADIQIHSWGDTLLEAFEQAANGMFGMMTELDTIDPSNTQEFEAEGDDMIGLLFHFLDEALFLMSGDYFICKRIKILEFDEENFKIKGQGYGEEFVIGKHPQDREVKAITYSNMQIQKENEAGNGKYDIFVIVDI